MRDTRLLLETRLRSASFGTSTCFYWNFYTTQINMQSKKFCSNHIVFKTNWRYIFCHILQTLNCDFLHSTYPLKSYDATHKVCVFSLLWLWSLSSKFHASLCSVKHTPLFIGTSNFSLQPEQKHAEVLDRRGKVIKMLTRQICLQSSFFSGEQMNITTIKTEQNKVKFLFVNRKHLSASPSACVVMTTKLSNNPIPKCSCTHLCAVKFKSLKGKDIFHH